MMLNFNLYPTKILAGLVAGILAVFVQNLLPLFMAVTVFEGVDFVTGCVKSGVVAHRNHENFAFESVKAWRTITSSSLSLSVLYWPKCWMRLLRKVHGYGLPTISRPSVAGLNFGRSLKTRPSFRTIQFSVGCAGL